MKKEKIKSEIENFGENRKNLSIEDQILAQQTTSEYIHNLQTNRNLQETNDTIIIDWSNMTGAVRHQGICGSCYALVPIQNLEFLLATHVFGFHLELSTQQILDCDFGLSLGC